MPGKWSRLNEELETIRLSLKRDPTNIELANRYWATIARGDYRSGRYVIEAYREAALTSSTGAATLVRAYRELFLDSGEGPSPQFFDERLIEALRSYMPQMAEDDRINVQWVLQTIAPQSLTDHGKP
jgi:hypothetical protein